MLLLLSACTMRAQVNLQNTGTLYISGLPDILYINGSFTNASGAALTNNGNLYVLQNLINGQTGMTAGTGTLYLNGAATQTVSGTQLFKTYNLITNNGTGIMLNNDLSVSGLHTFTAGVISTSAAPNYLMYEAGSSYTGDADSRHVNGWVRKTGSSAFIFPLGNGTVERTIATNNLSASAVFNARYGGATTNTGNVAAPLVTVDPYEYWIVNKISGGTANIDMNWDNTKIAMPNYPLADIRVASYIAGNWTQVGGTATGSTATTGAISSATLSSFGSFAFGSITVSLPVTLVQFSAYRNNGNAVVSWTTSDEINVSHYEVQRSDDGILFYIIGNVTARNVAALQQYEFTDTKALKEITYYRLRSVDTDGKAKLSKVVLVNYNNLTDKYLTIVNPAHSSIHVTAKNISGVFEYRINTLAGQTVQQGPVKIAAAGFVDINLPASIKNGLYILQIQKPGFSFSQKVLIQ
ncbi:MAG: T9SS type A sorting domain-containing protein [Chitinophagaceae bacterium]